MFTELGRMCEKTCDVKNKKVLLANFQIQFISDIVIEYHIEKKCVRRVIGRPLEDNPLCLTCRQTFSIQNFCSEKTEEKFVFIVVLVLMYINFSTGIEIVCYFVSHVYVAKLCLQMMVSTS